VAAVTAGVLLHLPMFFASRTSGYRLVGMHVDSTMMVGMALIVVGLGATTYGLCPRLAGAHRDQLSRLRVQALDDAGLTRAHVGLLVVTSVAVTIDLMKPITLSFVVPGVAKEYGLNSALHPQGHVPVALLPLAGIGGTVIGSLVWGWLGDRMGRRASILLAAVAFIGTAICGSMPSFNWNLAMCFLMGLAVGGMLPIAFALVAEVTPARHRSWLMVLIGGDVAGAYILTSVLAAWLEPHYGWRMLWLLGLPTGVALIALNHWIPESPRFLLATGRRAEADAVMARFGVAVVEDSGAPVDDEGGNGGFGQLLRRPFGGLTVGIGLFGLAYGLVNFGFLLWLPTNLRALGLGVGTSDRLLADSAMIGFPATFVVAYLYGFWSSKKTMVMVAAVTAAVLFAFALVGDRAATHRWLLEALLVVVLVGSSSVLAVLTPYSAEVYPTAIRSRGTGLAAAASKAGGVAGIGLVAASVAPPSLVGAALVGAVPTVVAAAVIGRVGVETRQRRLEEISADTLVGAAGRATT
jgi:putative MFS transporter